jgi:1-deoxy-D-xylulose-5-phosphate synthase
VLADIGLTPVEIAGRISASLAVRDERAKAENEPAQAADRPAGKAPSKEKPE